MAGKEEENILSGKMKVIGKNKEKEWMGSEVMNPGCRPKKKKKKKKSGKGGEKNRKINLCSLTHFR